MNRRLVIIGAGGHGKVCASVAKKMNQWKKILFLDDIPKDEVLGLKVLSPIDIDKTNTNDTDFFVALGDNYLREKYLNQLLNINASIITLIDPSSIVTSNSYIGSGSILMSGTIINCDVKIGIGSIINSGTIIEHDSQIGDYTHIAPGVNIAGGVEVGHFCTIGIGTTIINNLKIKSNILVGSHSNVTSNLSYPGTYFGSPAKFIRNEL